MNFLDADLGARNGSVVASSEGIEIEIAAARLPRGDGTRKATLGIRPEHFEIVAAGQGHATGEVYVVEPMGREQMVD
ncbi:MAG: hypothetical protein ABR591_16380, partial [Candidatus Velthaea sp.]